MNSQGGASERRAAIDSLMMLLMSRRFLISLMAACQGSAEADLLCAFTTADRRMGPEERLGRSTIRAAMGELQAASCPGSTGRGQGPRLRSAGRLAEPHAPAATCACVFIWMDWSKRRHHGLPYKAYT